MIWAFFMIWFLGERKVTTGTNTVATPAIADTKYSTQRSSKDSAIPAGNVPSNYANTSMQYRVIFTAVKKHKFQWKMLIFLAHLSRRLVGELIVYPWSGVRPSSTISNKNISATSRLIATKFHLKHHWVGGKAARGFGPDRIRTLVSMATESSHRVIMEKTVSPLFLSCFSSDPFHTCRQWWHA